MVKSGSEVVVEIPETIEKGEDELLFLNVVGRTLMEVGDLPGDWRKKLAQTHQESAFLSEG